MLIYYANNVSLSAIYAALGELKYDVLHSQHRLKGRVVIKYTAVHMWSDKHVLLWGRGSGQGAVLNPLSPHDTSNHYLTTLRFNFPTTNGF